MKAIVNKNRSGDILNIGIPKYIYHNLIEHKDIYGNSHRETIEAAVGFLSSCIKNFETSLKDNPGIKEYVQNTKDEHFEATGLKMIPFDYSDYIDRIVGIKEYFNFDSEYRAVIFALKFFIFDYYLCLPKKEVK